MASDEIYYLKKQVRDLLYEVPITSYVDTWEYICDGESYIEPGETKVNYWKQVVKNLQNEANHQYEVKNKLEKLVEEATSKYSTKKWWNTIFEQGSKLEEIMDIYTAIENEDEFGMGTKEQRQLRYWQQFFVEIEKAKAEKKAKTEKKAASEVPSSCF